VIPPTPVTEEAIPQKIEEKTEDTEPIDTAPIGNAPVFVDPAHGDPNPFENAPPTEIEDHPVDEFIEEGDDKPAAERDPCGFFQSVEFFSENLLTNEKMPGIIYLNQTAHT
jgi:hypothetical protein